MIYLGLEKFYKIPESQASFQEATKYVLVAPFFSVFLILRNFIGYKVPAEVMTGNLNQVLAVLKKDFSANWLRIFTDTVLEVKLSLFL